MRISFFEGSLLPALVGLRWSQKVELAGSHAEMLCYFAARPKLSPRA